MKTRRRYRTVVHAKGDEPPFDRRAILYRVFGVDDQEGGEEGEQNVDQK